MPDKNLLNNDLLKKIAKKASPTQRIEFPVNASYSNIYLNKPKRKKIPFHSPGSILAWDKAKREVMRFENENALLSLGAKGNEGNLIVKNSLGKDAIHLNGKNADMHIGTTGKQGDIYLYNSKGQNTVHVSGQAGDIILKNGDAAEHFDIAENVIAAPGTIMVLDTLGTLIPSDTPYNTKVIGVVAGAGDYKPAIVLDTKENSINRVPISILGKVTCKAEAINQPIAVGDMLTTSGITGHAMKATDTQKSFGAIVGKALTSLAEGKGYVNMLVNLQ